MPVSSITSLTAACLWVSPVSSEPVTVCQKAPKLATRLSRRNSRRDAPSANTTTWTERGCL